MTLHRMAVYEVECDAAGCLEWSEQILPRHADQNKARGVRAEIAGRGWTHIGGKDYCPEHSNVRVAADVEAAATQS